MAHERERLINAQNCTNMRVRRAARAITDFYDAIMKPAGLHGNQFMLLIPPYLQPGLTINQLAQIAALDRTTLARNLKLLEERQLITLQPGEDQRTRVIRLTDRGCQALFEALPRWEEAQRRLDAYLAEAQLAQLSGRLDKLEDLLDRGSTDLPG